MTTYPSQIERAVALLNDTGMTRIIVSGEALVNALEPIRGRLPAEARRALDAFREALGEK